MKEYIGLGIIAFSLIFAMIAAFMAWRLKQRLDAANSKVALEKAQREERRRTYQEVITLLDNAVSSITKGSDYPFDNLFNELTPKLHLHASEDINSSFVEVCLLIENWTAMKDDVQKTEKELKRHPEQELILSQQLEEQRKQAEDAYQLFKNRFSKLSSMMRKEMSESF